MQSNCAMYLALIIGGDTLNLDYERFRPPSVLQINGASMAAFAKARAKGPSVSLPTMPARIGGPPRIGQSIPDFQRRLDDNFSPCAACGSRLHPGWQCESARVIRETCSHCLSFGHSCLRCPFMEATQDEAVELSQNLMGKLLSAMDREGRELPLAVTSVPRCFPGLPDSDPRVARILAIVEPPLRPPPPKQGGPAAAAGLPLQGKGRGNQAGAGNPRPPRKAPPPPPALEAEIVRKARPGKARTVPPPPPAKYNPPGLPGPPMAMPPKAPPPYVGRGGDKQYLVCPQSKSFYKASDPLPKGRPSVPDELQAFLPKSAGPAIGSTVIVKAQTAPHQMLILAE